jgi:BirA family biotin operon repressor/biotin-[acetyl-CoA-carboxylase] ligase
MDASSQGRPRTEPRERPAASTPGKALSREALLAGAARRWLARTIHCFDEIDSTNRLALELAAQGEAHGSAVIAEAQSAGRGRLGRSFHSPPGTNLYVSLVLRPQAAAAGLATLPLAAGVAVAEAVADELGDAQRVALKWPNDVLVDGRKLSGLLLERVGTSAAGAVILGIGVNLNVDPESFPAEFRERATSLGAAAGRPIDRARFASALFDRLEGVLDLHDARGFEALRERFEALFRMQGAHVRVADAAGAVREGRVAGVGADGSLRLATASGEERVFAGDVSVVKEALP